MMPMFWVIVGPAFLLAIWAQAKVSATFAKYSRVAARSLDPWDSHRFRGSRKAIDAPAPRGEHGRSLGSAEFVARLERELGRPLAPGRPTADSRRMVEVPISPVSE